MRYVALLSLALLGLFSGVEAREVAGVDVPEQIRFEADNTPLHLNGAGVRRKLFFDIYIGALYLPQAGERDPARIIDAVSAKRVSMHILHAEIPAEKLVRGWKDGFAANLSAEELRALRPRIANFNGLFPTLRRGDQVHFDFVPNSGVQVWINGKLRGRVAGADFSRALLRIWLGEKPADKGLKKALLGGR